MWGAASRASCSKTLADMEKCNGVARWTEFNFLFGRIHVLRINQAWSFKHPNIFALLVFCLHAAPGHPPVRSLPVFLGARARVREADVAVRAPRAGDLADNLKILDLRPHLCCKLILVAFISFPFSLRPRAVFGDASGDRAVFVEGERHVVERRFYGGGNTLCVCQPPTVFLLFSNHHHIRCCRFFAKTRTTSRTAGVPPRPPATFYQIPES